MNSIGSTTRARYNLGSDGSQTPNLNKNRKKYAFRKTRTFKQEGPKHKNFQKQSSIISKNSDLPNIVLSPSKNNRVFIDDQDGPSGRGHSHDDFASGYFNNSSQGNFSHAYTNMMKENFKYEDFDS